MAKKHDVVLLNKETTKFGSPSVGFHFITGDMQVKYITAYLNAAMQAVDVRLPKSFECGPQTKRLMAQLVEEKLKTYKYELLPPRVRFTSTTGERPLTESEKAVVGEFSDVE